MHMRNNAGQTLEDFRAPVKIKLALLWASLMFLYIYNDYFSLYTPGKIDDIAAGRIGSLGEATEPVMVGVSMLLAVPTLMIFLSVALAPPVSRRLNIMLGLAYTAIEALTLFGSRPFYQIVVALEIALTVLIVWCAWRWPKTGPIEIAE
jgi:Family of unknown function (DUF6326)